MTKKIFKHIIFTVIATSLVIIGLFLSVLYGYFGTQINSILKQEAVLIEQAYYNNGLDYFTGLTTNTRITLITESGTVLYDSRANDDKMENHLERPEVIQALDKGEGYASRRSDTIGEQSIYYAKKLSDGTILRVATGQKSIWSLLIGMSSHIFWIAVLAILMAFLLAKRASDAIVGPINQMDVGKDKIAIYHELQPFVNKIQSQNITISSQLDELKRRSKEFNTITENMPEGLIVTNAKLEVLSYNRSASEIFKLDNIQEKQSVYQFYHATSFIDAMNEAINSKQNQDLHLNIDNRYYQMLIAPVTTSGVVVGATIIVKDITETEAQEQIRREFSANVSHELKTPLTSILGFAELMQKGLVDNKDIKEISGDIVNEARRLINLINDIIHLSSLESPNLANTKTDFVVSEIVNSVFKTLDQSAKQKNITLAYQGDAVSYYGIASVFEEIIYNLCDNAIRYGKEKGQVAVMVSKDDKWLHITVKDDGIGIPDSDQARIFERFYRVDKSHSKALGGTGLGLSIVKHGVILHEGKIELESKVGEGTCFKMTFPIV